MYNSFSFNCYFSAFEDIFTVNAVPMTPSYVPHSEISYAKFISLFGKAAISKPEKYFATCWQNERIVLVGTFGTRQEVDWNSRHYFGYEFHLGQNRPKEQCEPIILLVETTNAGVLGRLEQLKPDSGLNSLLK